MKTNTTPPIEWNIIARKLKGSPLTKEEENTFRRWIESDHTHREYFLKAQRMWDTEDFTYPPTDLETLIKQFDAKTQPAKPRFFQQIHIYRWQIAATIIILFSISFFWIGKEQKQNVPNKTTSITSYNHHIRPGKSQANLILDNGQQITLDKNSSEQIIKEQNGRSITISEGTITYNQNAVADKESYNTLVIPRGGEYCLQLSDGSKVWLNANTRLHYPTHFMKEQRIVELEGEAYFEVKKDPLHPFIVQTSQATIQVYGTSFNVRAYHTEAIQHTTLAEGKVSVRRAGKTYMLSPGQQARIDQANETVVIEKVNPALYCSWHQGLFIFENRCLEDILNQLADWYDVEFIYEKASLKQLHFTGDLERYADFNDILSLIGMTTNVHFNIQGQTVTVSSQTRP